MKLKHSIVEVPVGNPYANDKLGRGQHAEILTRFLADLDEPLTLTVEAGWGHGKTTFLRMWFQHLKDQNYSCISFNAWESDFSEDPLIPFVTEIGKAVAELDDGSGKATKLLQDLSGRLKKSGIQVAKRTLPIAAKLLTAGLLNGEEFAEESASEAIEQAIKDKFDEYDADKNTLDDFKSTLSDVVKTLRDHGKKLPLVFMIDELDRCRPTYGLALLERIKHIFNVDGIAFVLAIDRSQLTESIRTVYGSGTDAHRYLRRFVDFRYTLPDPNPEMYPAHLMSVFGFGEEFLRANRDHDEAGHFLKAFIALSTAFDMRLRDQEHAFSKLAVFWRTVKDGEHVEPFVLATLLVLKTANVDMYMKLVKAELRATELISYINGKPSGLAFLENEDGPVFEAMLHASLESDVFIKQKLDELAAISHSSQAQSRGWSYVDYARKILKNHTAFKRDLGKLIQKLEVTQQFVV